MLEMSDIEKEEKTEEKSIEEIIMDTLLDTIDFLERAIDRIQGLRIDQEEKFYEYCDIIGTDDVFVDDTISDIQFVIDNLSDGIITVIRDKYEGI